MSSAVLNEGRMGGRLVGLVTKRDLEGQHGTSRRSTEKLNRFGRVWVVARRRNLLVASVMNRDVAANLMASLRFQ